ncbi:large protein with signal peptide [Cryptosporidium felis]|nr:large protein with signal peptide [Cryptosporidium felis]
MVKIRRFLGLSASREGTFKKLPKLRPKINKREKNKVNAWNDFGVGLKSEWPEVPVEAALFEFLVEFYQGIGKSLKELMEDLLFAMECQGNKGTISAKLASEIVGDSLGVKLMETIVVNKYYSPKIEAIRTLERAQREAFGVNCRKGAGWSIVIYREETFDILCDLSDLFGTLSKGRRRGYRHLEKLSSSISRLENDHVISDFFLGGHDPGKETVELEVFTYIDFSDPSFFDQLSSVSRVWNLVKGSIPTKIILRHCDNNKVGDGFEFLTGFGVFVGKNKNSESESLAERKRRISKIQFSHGFQGELKKSHKDEEYESIAALCDQAVNMENVLNSDGELSAECMSDIGSQLVSVSRRFEDQLGAMIHYLENFGSYQLAFCKGLRENGGGTVTGLSKLHERVAQGSTLLSINGRQFSPKETTFFNLVPVLKRLIFSKVRLERNEIETELVIDSLSITGMHEKKELNLFLENLGGNYSEDVRTSSRFSSVIKDQELKERISRGDILNKETISEFNREFEEDPVVLEDLDWLGKRELFLSSSYPWTKYTPRTDWRITSSLPAGIQNFYRDITNIGDSQWGETPGIFEEVWFSKNITAEGMTEEAGKAENEGLETRNGTEKVEYSPWMMYRVYFTSQVKSSRLVQGYAIYDIMKEPESALGQYLYPLMDLPELFRKLPENVGIYPVKAAILEVVVLCDPFDIECITVIIEIMNRKWPIRLNLLLVDPEWVNIRKPDFSNSFSYQSIKTEDDFQKKFKEDFETRRTENGNQTVCERYFGKKGIENCPSWLEELDSEPIKAVLGLRRLGEDSRGEFAIKMAISEIFGFLVSSSVIQGMFLARAFLEMIAKNLPIFLEESYSLSNFQEFLGIFFKHFSVNAELDKVWEMIYSNNPNDVSYVNRVLSYCRLKGFTFSGALVNGYFVEITDLALDEVIYGIARKEQRIILEGVRDGSIKSDDDIFEYILNHTKSINTIPIVFPPFTKSIKIENWPFQGVQNEWKHAEIEIKARLHNKYDSEKNSTEVPYKARIELSEETDLDKRIVLDLDDLSRLEYSLLWDLNPALKINPESIEKKSKQTPWITFIAVVRSNRAGLLGLATLLDFWISTLSFQASLQLNMFNDLLFNRRFSLLIIPSSVKYDLSRVLQRCINDIFGWKGKITQTGLTREPILDKLRFTKWFITLVAEYADSFQTLATREDQNLDSERTPRPGQDQDAGSIHEKEHYHKMESKVVEVYTGLWKLFFKRKSELEGLSTGWDFGLDPDQLNVREKLVRKFSTRYWDSSQDEVFTFPYHSLGNGKLKGYPKHVNYNLSREKSDERFGKASFRKSELSDRDCYETFTMGIVINGVYLRVCPTVYPVYLRDDARVNYWSSPIHSGHFKLMELAVTSRMRQLVLLGEYKKSEKKAEDVRYRAKWNRLHPNEVFVLVNEHLYISNQFKSDSVLQLEELYSSSSSSVKLHLPGVRRDESSSKVSSLIQVVAVVNPISDAGSYLLRLLGILHELLEADVRIIYNPAANYKNLEQVVLVDTWRRYVFNYPKVIVEHEEKTDRFTNLLQYSSKNPTEFVTGNDTLYFLNSQFFAKFEMQTSRNLRLSIEKDNHWKLAFWKAIVEEGSRGLGSSDGAGIFSATPSNLFRPEGSFLIFELKGKTFESTIMMDFTEAGNYNRTQIQMTLSDVQTRNSQRVFYSLSDFSSFGSFLRIGTNELNIRHVRSSEELGGKELVSNIRFEIFNQRLFEKGDFVVHLADFPGVSVPNRKKEAEGVSTGSLIRTLHILCVSPTKEMNEFVIETLIELIDAGFTIGSGYYNKFVIYMDDRYTSQIVRDYYSYKLFWKYYIRVEYVEINLPGWIPPISLEIPDLTPEFGFFTSVLETLITLDTWIPPGVHRLLVLDPVSLDVKAEFEEFVSLLRSKGSPEEVPESTFNSMHQKEQRKSTETGTPGVILTPRITNTRMALLNVKEYRRNRLGIKKAYLGLHHDLRQGRNEEHATKTKESFREKLLGHLGEYINSKESVKQQKQVPGGEGKNEGDEEQ